MMIASVMGIFGLLMWLAFLLVPMALLIVFQVWLCRKSLKLGLILPVLSLLLSLLMVVSFTGFSSMGGGSSLTTVDGVLVERSEHKNGTVTVYDGEGNVIDQYPDPNYDPEKAGQDTARAVLTVAVLFLVTNIPTVIYGGIWLHYKGRRDTQDDLKRMRLEDLG